MDDKIVTLPTLLDGKVTPRGQGREGNEAQMKADLLEYLKLRMYPAYICYKGNLTDEDYMILWDGDHRDDFLPINERIRRQTAYQDVMDKIDWVKTNQLLEAKLQKQRNEAKAKNTRYTLGAREFTLTYSPKWFNDEEARSHMKAAIEKLIKYYSEDIIHLRAVGEVGSNGLSHIHCFYKLRQGLKITDKNFKRAYKYWNPKKVTSRTGHEGGHHANVRDEADFQGYIDKDIDTAWYDKYYPTEDPR